MSCCSDDRSCGLSEVIEADKCMVTADMVVYGWGAPQIYCLKKNMTASRPSEHPPVRGENVKTFRWDHRLQIQNLFVAFERVPRW